MASISSNSPKISHTQAPGSNPQVALYALMTLFFMMGFITCLNDILIPYMKAIFKLNYTQANLINLCFFGAYGTMSFLSSVMVQRIGYKRAMIAGFILAALGCVLFYPAAGSREYPIFLAALFILATGIVILQVAGNPYVTVLGPAETAPARLTLTQAFNSIATMIAPFVGSALILANLPADLKNTPVDQIDVSAVQQPYLVIAGVLVFIALLVSMLKLPEMKTLQPEATTQHAEHKSIWQYPHLWLGALGIFTYVGAEVAIGSHIVSYLKEPSILSLPEDQAGNYVSYYWGGAMVGRFIGSLALNRSAYGDKRFFLGVVLISLLGFGFIAGTEYISAVLRHQSMVFPWMKALIFGICSIGVWGLQGFLLKLKQPGKILAFNAVLAAILTLIASVTQHELAVYSLLLVGLMNSLMFATIFTLSVAGLGQLTDRGSGILSTAIFGGALVPVAFGALGDAAGLRMAFIIPVICYAYIAWFGLKGHQSDNI